MHVWAVQDVVKLPASAQVVVKSLFSYRSSSNPCFPRSFNANSTSTLPGRLTDKSMNDGKYHVAG